jgi:hypothetical protein
MKEWNYEKNLGEFIAKKKIIWFKILIFYIYELRKNTSMPNVLTKTLNIDIIFHSFIWVYLWKL